MEGPREVARSDKEASGRAHAPRDWAGSTLARSLGSSIGEVLLVGNCLTQIWSEPLQIRGVSPSSVV